MARGNRVHAQDVRRFAHTLAVEINLGEEYDDEHDYYTSGQVTCMDREKLFLEMDPAYYREITQPLRSANYGTADDDETVDGELIQEAIFSYQQPLLPLKSATYVIDQPPESLPVFAIRKQRKGACVMIKTCCSWSWIGPLRPATTEEIRAHLGRVGLRAEWEQVRDFAHSLYGPCASSAEIETAYEYDDEGGYFPRFEDITVYDRQGNALEFDLSTDWWQREHWFAEWSDDQRSCKDYLYDQVREEARELLVIEGEERLVQELAWDNRFDLFAHFDLPIHQDQDENSYSLDQPPPIGEPPLLYTPVAPKKLTSLILFLTLLAIVNLIAIRKSRKRT